MKINKILLQIDRFLVAVIVSKGQRLSPHAGLGVTWLKNVVDIMHNNSNRCNSRWAS